MSSSCHEKFQQYLEIKMKSVKIPTDELFVERSYQEISSAEEGPIFTTLSNGVENFDAVLLIGEAGMGKSSSLKRMLREWCNGEILQCITLFLLISCKDINHSLTELPDDVCFIYSMAKNTFKKYGRIPLSTLNLLAKEKKLLIAVDGIDEFSIQKYLTKKYRGCIEAKISGNGKLTGMETVAAIMSGELLSGCKVIVTGKI